MSKNLYRYRQAAVLHKCDPDHGTRVAQGLGLDAARVKALAEMSHQERAAATAA